MEISFFDASCMRFDFCVKVKLWMNTASWGVPPLCVEP